MIFENNSKADVNQGAKIHPVQLTNVQNGDKNLLNCTVSQLT